MANSTVTIGHLSPEDSREPEFRSLKDSARYHGSYVLNLKRPSKVPGFSRKYFPGDPLNMIDWKVFGRTEQLLVREDRDQASGHILVCIDVSESMLWPEDGVYSGSLSNVPTKLEVACRLAFNMAYRHMKAADFVKVVLYSGGAHGPDRGLFFDNPSDVSHFFDDLKGAGFLSSFFDDKSEPFFLEKHNVDLVYFISDCMNLDSLALWFGRPCVLQVFHTLSSLEINSEWLHSETCYFDHSADRAEYIGKHLRDGAEIHKLVKRWRLNLKSKVESSGAIYNLYSDATTIDEFHRSIAITEF